MIKSVKKYNFLAMKCVFGIMMLFKNNFYIKIYKNNFFIFNINTLKL
jgi:hypothetical protein